MLDLSPLLDPRVIQIILSDPSQLSAFINVDELRFLFKIIILAFLFLYILFSVVFFIQMRRIQQWLMSLKPYHFPRWALIHLVLASVGWILALVIL